MSIEYTIKEDYILIIARGASSFEEVTAQLAQITTHPDYRSPARILFDACHTDYGPPAEELESIVEHLEMLAAFVGSRWAIVARSETHMYGIARMFCGFAEYRGFYAETFSDQDAAIDWLFQPLSVVSPAPGVHS